ncbi:MAG TPA: hypothetical protein VG347_24830 [Verrucomicrobiae bacterium]|nr:hypothetical protein [Verrucomicrobiae bacterium]
MNPTKFCKGCQTEKSEDEFYKTAAGKIRAGCKSCRCANTSKNQRGRYRKNPAAAKARQKRWREKHPDQFREIMRLQMAKQRRRRRDVGQGFLPIDPK